ncbi:MAG: DUF4258 domain-containing protein [Candidatus Altiarchaeota archaeon]|nr:DUF4258 domain-containing protein [Candidatus Altiarchaeota archaeon]
MEVVLLYHLKSQARERGIDIKLIEETLFRPGQVIPDLQGLKVAHKRYFDGDKNKEYLIRVVYREEEGLRIGITVYKTSKIKKYWRV